MRSGYVAFLDVLGFSSLVAADHDGTAIDGYLSCLNDALSVDAGNERVDYVAFSDSIVLTTQDDTDDALKAILRACSVVLSGMLEKGNCAARSRRIWPIYSVEDCGRDICSRPRDHRRVQL